MDKNFGRIKLAILLIALILLSASVPAGAVSYTTTQISTLGGGDLGLFTKINAKGEVAWAGNYFDSPGLYLYSDGQVKQLTNNKDINNFDINELGQVVWSASTSNGYNLFLYKNGVTTTITTDGNNNFEPSFNDKGDFVWNSYDGSKARIKLRTAAGIISTIWTCPSYSELNTMFTYPVINNLGQVAWINHTIDNKDNIYFYDGQANIVHTSNSFYTSYPYSEPLRSLNNRGDLVFTSLDGIWLKKSGATAQQIAIPLNLDYRPRINDSGLVVYVGDNVDYSTAIYLYGSTGSQKISDNGVCPDVNNQGQIIWTNVQGIYLYSQNSSSRIVTYGNGGYLRPMLNDSGLLAWQGSWSGDGIFLSRPVNILPIISVTPTTLDFGKVPKGTGKELTLTVKNTGIGTLTGNATTAAPFSIVSGGSYSLGADQSQVVTIRYLPTSRGIHTGAVVFTGGDGATVQVTGKTEKPLGLSWLLLLLGN